MNPSLDDNARWRLWRVRPSRSRQTSHFDKACAARSGRLHEPELVEEFGLSDACGGAGPGRLRLQPPTVTPPPPSQRPAGHTRRRFAPSPSRSQPPLRALPRPFQEAGARTICSRLPPTGHSTDVSGEPPALPYALKPPTALPYVRVVPGWLGRILPLVRELRRGRGQGKRGP
jgi:hypothetical protein